MPEKCNFILPLFIHLLFGVTVWSLLETGYFSRMTFNMATYGFSSASSLTACVPSQKPSLGCIE